MFPVAAPTSLPLEAAMSTPLGMQCATSVRPVFLVTPAMSAAMATTAQAGCAFAVSAMGMQIAALGHAYAILTPDTA